MNLLIGVTGSVASIKLPELLLATRKRFHGVSIRIVGTPKGMQFVRKEEIADDIYTDDDEWSTWKARGDNILHIYLRNWADIFLIAPLDANTLAKIATGLCDNLLTCIVRAWDPKKPLLLCPAMNTYMWTNPPTVEHLSMVEKWGYKIVMPIEKTLMCGEKGLGAMAALETIIEKLVEVLGIQNTYD